MALRALVPTKNGLPYCLKFVNAKKMYLTLTASKRIIYNHWTLYSHPFLYTSHYESVTDMSIFLRKQNVTINIIFDKFSVTFVADCTEEL